MPQMIQYDERGRPVVQRSYMGQATPGTAVRGGGANVRRPGTESRFQPTVERAAPPGPTMVAPMGGASPPVGQQLSRLRQRASDFLPELPGEFGRGAAYEAGVSTRRGIGEMLTGAATSTIPRTAYAGVQAGGRFVGGAGRFLSGLVGLDESERGPVPAAQAAALEPTQTDVSRPAPAQQVGVPAVETPVRADPAAVATPVERRGQAIPRAGTGYIIGPSGRRVDIETDPRERLQQARGATRTRAVRTGAEQFRVPRAPGLGGARGGPFAQMSQFINQYGQFIGQARQRRQELVERRAVAKSARERRELDLEVAKADLELAKFLTPEYETTDITREDLGGVQTTVPVFYNPRDPRQFFTLGGENVGPGAPQRSPEETRQAHQEAREAISQGFDPGAVNRRLQEQGYAVLF